MISEFRIRIAINNLKKGIIAIPTDTIYGLSCLPNNHKALKKLLLLKKRSPQKGLILLASDYRYFLPYVAIPACLQKMLKINKNTLSPTTYLVDANKNATKFLSGGFNTIALRITDKPLIKQLCQKTNSALVSTSANITEKKNITSILQLKVFFKNDIDFIIAPENNNNKPSAIVNLSTGQIHR